MAEELLRSRHAFGNSADVFTALEAGKFDAYDILFLDGATEPKVGWVDKDNNVRIVDNECVFVVEELPESGEAGKVYIFDDEGYFWNGNQFVNFCKPTDLTALEAHVAELEAALAEVKSVLVTHEEALVKHEEKTNVVYKKVKYEVTDTPVGTLADYREDEVRIMCPAGAEFTKQSVGAGGDENSYYITFKTYAPSDDIVGYIEHLNGAVDSEILTDLKTDKYGRKYQPTWLAVAKYDEATGVWAYYGANSTVEKYIGWNYQIDWYNADGVMVASDSIRINLSNEECHSVIEPYYVSNVIADATERAKLYTDEQIASVLAAFTVVEF